MREKPLPERANTFSGKLSESMISWVLGVVFVVGLVGAAGRVAVGTGMGMMGERFVLSWESTYEGYHGGRALYE